MPDTMSEILTHYINQGFECGKFPDELKTAKIIPLYKKNGQKHDTKSYRPISILNVESKIFEACMYDRL